MSRSSDFWSRRKAKVLEEQQDEMRASERREAAERDAELEAKTDEDVLEELGLPDPDALQPGDDFSAFMAKAVPDRIRRRALRRLWLSNPALANLDGLLDYGEDFTDSATVVENLQTAYQVGKGMLKHVEELARQAEVKAADSPEEHAEPVSSEHSEPVADVSFAEAGDDSQDEEPQAHLYAFEDDHDAHEVAPRRRMRFAFDTSEGAQA
ncbi:DUF3306 domain-containing protein [uncultured Roseovarius sp.]|uniref:DUF3306 domain-containing protein n=1 Tax=uncultured Roseovarius sp. TaxID=293344 RepID=UPI00260143E8|nr:DUF3306 domain-containing protein [uncultured Roseovarius sp.]